MGSSGSGGIRLHPFAGRNKGLAASILGESPSQNKKNTGGYTRASEDGDSKNQDYGRLKEPGRHGTGISESNPEEEEEEEEGFLKLGILGLCHVFSSALYLCKALWDIDGGEKTTLNTILVLNGIGQLVNTPLKLTFLATSPKNSQSIREHTRAWFTGGIFFLWIAGVFDLLVVFLNILNPRDRLITPIFCAVNNSGLGFVVLISLIGSTAFLVEYIYHSFLALSCTRLQLLGRTFLSNPADAFRIFWRSYCCTNLFSGILVVGAGVSMISFYVIFFEEDEDLALLRFHILYLSYQVGNFIILWFGLTKTADQKQDRTFEIHIQTFSIKSYTHHGVITFLFGIGASAGGLLLAIDVMFSTLERRSSSWILLFPPLVAISSLTCLLLYYSFKTNGEKFVFDTTRISKRLNVFFCTSPRPKRNIFYTILMMASIVAHGLGAQNQLDYEDHEDHKPYIQTMWSNFLEICVTLLIYANVIMRPTKKEKFDPLASVLFQVVVIVNWVGAIIEDVSHMHHNNFEECDRHDGSHDDDSQLVYAELTLLAFYTEFCLYSWQIFGENVGSHSEHHEKKDSVNPAEDHETGNVFGRNNDASFPQGYTRGTVPKYVNSMNVVRNPIQGSRISPAGSTQFQELKDNRYSNRTPSRTPTAILLATTPEQNSSERMNFKTHLSNPSMLLASRPQTEKTSGSSATSGSRYNRSSGMSMNTGTTTPLSGNT